jgi:hypothetical protein
MMVEWHHFRFIDRAMGLKMLGRDPDERLRNYEIEHELDDQYDGKWIVSEWCPFNGRFCNLGKFVPPPHPPMRDEEPKPPATAIPWNEFDVTKIPEAARSLPSKGPRRDGKGSL